MIAIAAGCQSGPCLPPGMGREGRVNREVRTAFGAAIGLIGLIVAFIFLIRYVVPSILAAPFSASLISAVAVAVVGVVALAWAGWRLWVWARRSFNR